MRPVTLKRKFSGEWGVLTDDKRDTLELVRVEYAAEEPRYYFGIERGTGTKLAPVMTLRRVADVKSSWALVLAHLATTGENQGITDIQGSLNPGTKGLRIRINGEVVGETLLRRQESHRFIQYIKLLLKEAK